MLTVINIISFIVFSVGVGLYLFRTKTLFIYPGMKQPESRLYEMALAGFGLITFVITISIKGYINS